MKQILQYAGFEAIGLPVINEYATIRVCKTIKWGVACMSNIDFTFAKYTDLCKTIVDAGYSTLTFTQFFSLHNMAEQVIILRHDVDRKPERALQIAKIENSFGIRSTYYFRKNEDVFKPAMINEIVNMGHEIGLRGAG